MQNAGNDTRILEILYLDRDRLLSYASQLYDGLTMMKRIIDMSSNAEIKEIISRQVGILKEKNNKFVGKTSLAVEAGVELETKHQENTVTTSGDVGDIGLLANLFMEEKTEHDNLFLLVEKELFSKGILKEFDSKFCKGGLYRFKGNASFTDWGVIKNTVANITIFKEIDKDIDLGLTSKQGKAFVKLLNMFAFDDVVLNLLTNNGTNILATLNSDHLTMTVEQLRVAYLTKGSIEMTLIGIIPPEGDGRQSPQLGAVSKSINVKQLYKSVLGDVDFKIYPIAAYLNLHS